jgi:hypothetical protein
MAAYRMNADWKQCSHCAHSTRFCAKLIPSRAKGRNQEPEKPPFGFDFQLRPEKSIEQFARIELFCFGIIPDMTYVLLTEGTGKGVHERTNVSVLADACVQDSRQCVHLERGPGTKIGAVIAGHVFGLGAVNIAMRHYEWLAQRYRPSEDAKIFIFGFSRGALVARALADLICSCGIAADAYDARKVFKWWMGGHYPEAVEAFRRERRLMPGRVDYLGVWDTVDSSVGIDGDRYRRVPDKVGFARHAVARDERRCFFSYVPMEGDNVEEVVFPGSHSDIGGLYPDNSTVAELALGWIAAPAVARGLRLKPGVRFAEDVSPDDVVLHDSQNDATNVWGLLPSPARILTNIKHHPLCKIIAAPFSD